MCDTDKDLEFGDLDNLLNETGAILIYCSKNDIAHYEERVKKVAPNRKVLVNSKDIQTLRALRNNHAVIISD